MTERRILLCATGLSPQIVTETLYALAVQGDWVPHEIHLITTTEGRRRAELTLLDRDPDQRMFHRLCEDYGLDTGAIRFGPDTIHTIGGETPLDDIRSPEDNETTADTITAVVRELTADPNTAVHASIAGGRKTMGFYLGYAMSLFGRPQDRLSHVLVSVPFESHPQFFFPPKRPRVLYDKSDRPIDTDQARLTLAMIPFVRLRDGLTDLILEGGASFSAAVAQAQRVLTPPELVLDAATRSAHCGGVAIILPPIDFAFYTWFAQRGQAQEQALARHEWDRRHAGEILAIYLRLTRKDPDSTDDPTVRKLRTLAERSDTSPQEMEARIKYFEQRLSRLQTRLVRCLGEGPAQPYRIHNGPRGKARYGLRLQATQIRFADRD